MIEVPEVPQEQLNTIYELASRAVNMAGSIYSTAANAAPGSEVADGIKTIMPASPLAAEIFKTLVRCHVQNKNERAMEEANAAMKVARGDLPMAQSVGPSYFGGPKI